MSTLHWGVGAKRENEFRGWILDTSSDATITVLFYIDERLVGQCEARHMRKHVAEKFNTSGLHGYKFVPPLIYCDGVARRFQVVEGLTGAVIVDEERSFERGPEDVLEDAPSDLGGSNLDIGARGAAVSKDASLDVPRVVPPSVTTPADPIAVSYRSLVLHVGGYDDDALARCKDVAIYVSYTSGSSFYDHQRRQVAALREAGFFVVGVHALGGASSDWWGLNLCDVDIFKANIGYDFGSWWVGLQWLRRNLIDFEQRIHTLILANDSYFGCVSAESIVAMTQSEADLVGVCDSFQHNHHIQSFFVTCRGALLRSGEFTRALQGYSFPTAKSDVIRFGELFLTSDATSVGASISAICGYRALAAKWLERLPQKIERERELQARLGFRSASSVDSLEDKFLAVLNSLRRGIPLNPSHVFWEEIIHSGVGLVKRELLLQNPADVPDYLSLCVACVKTGVVSSASLKDYLSSEKNYSFAPDLVRVLESE